MQRHDFLQKSVPGAESLLPGRNVAIRQIRVLGKGASGGLEPAAHHEGLLTLRICTATFDLDAAGSFSEISAHCDGRQYLTSHPLLEGVWSKAESEASCSYLIVHYGKESIDRGLDMTKRAGLKYVYHSSPFEPRDHFKLKPDFFTHGREGLGRCAQKARRSGVRIGFPTLSHFTTPNDPYVTPKPDPHLARIGASILTAHTDPPPTQILVTADQYY